MNLDLNNLHWYGWALLAISAAGFLNEVAGAMRYVRRGDVGVSFLVPICGLTIVLYMLVSA